MSEETQKNPNNTGVVLGWIEKIGELLKKYGLQNIFLSIMVLFLTIVVGQVAFNPESLMKRMDNIKQKAHTEAVIKRLENEPKIRENLVNLRAELRADRVYILEW